MHNEFEESEISLNHNSDRSLVRNRTISDVNETSPKLQSCKFSFSEKLNRGGPKYLKLQKPSQSKFQPDKV